MKWGATVFLVFFAAFILLLIFNPNLSCFGKRVRSPFYPLRRRRRRGGSAGPEKKIETMDYGFHPADETPGAPKDAAPGEPKTPTPPPAGKTEAQKKARDYGFKLD